MAQAAKPNTTVQKPVHPALSEAHGLIRRWWQEHYREGYESSLCDEWDDAAVAKIGDECARKKRQLEVQIAALALDAEDALSALMIAKHLLAEGFPAARADTLLSAVHRTLVKVAKDHTA
jgi:hypothetical protein